MNIHFANPDAAPVLERPIVRIVIVGHVDHGKSTLIGRLLHETGSLPDGKLENLKAVSARRGMPFEWSFLLDALQTERDQGITIDTSQIHFRTASRDIVLIDAPGHTEFLRNMITGASQADAAILIIDAAEGVREQTRRHGYLLHLLGVRQVAVVVNKMDRVDYSATRFQEIEKEITEYLAGLGVVATAVIPISARNGDGVSRRTDAIGWHTGPTVLEALDQFIPAAPPQNLTLRLPVQAVYKFDERRIIAGRIETGSIAVGNEVAIMPGNKRAIVKSIESWPVPNESQVPQDASAGQSVGITLDRELFIERGHIVSLASSPATAGRELRVRVFWLHQSPLAVGTKLMVRIGTAESRGVVVAIEKAIDPGALEAVANVDIGTNNVGEVVIALSYPLAADIHTVNPLTGRVVLELDGRIAGGGLLLAMREGNDVRQGQTKTAETAVAPVIAPGGPGVVRLAAKAAELAPRLSSLSPVERLVQFRRDVEGKISFTTSFGIEDQALLHMIHRSGIDVDVVTLDTGRLFPEAYDLWAETERHFGLRIRAIYPRHEELEQLVAQHGINGFYDSREARTSCCFVRKVEPLNRALKDSQGWITGLRADQSANRLGMHIVTAEADRHLLKLSPLLDWSREQVVDFAKTNDIPVNPLHAQGFLSIGCAPCTRAIRPGEPERAGRWWWEDETKKECGLHDRHR